MTWAIFKVARCMVLGWFISFLFFPQHFLGCDLIFKLVPTFLNQLDSQFANILDNTIADFTNSICHHLQHLYSALDSTCRTKLQQNKKNKNSINLPG